MARAPERLVQVADDSGAALVYSDFRERSGADGRGSSVDRLSTRRHTRQLRFRLGGLLSREAVVKALRDHGEISPDIRWGGLYDLRLKLSIDSTIFRIPEPLYTRAAADLRASGEDFRLRRPAKTRLPDRNGEDRHRLERIGARLEPRFADLPESREVFPVKASVIIPVRNRVKTIRRRAQRARLRRPTSRLTSSSLTTIRPTARPITPQSRG